MKQARTLTSVIILNIVAVYTQFPESIHFYIHSVWHLP